MHDLNAVPTGPQQRALWLSTISFATCFAVWTVFSIIGVRIQQQLGLNETAFGLLIATPILTGSVTRLFLGIWADQYGGRRVFAGVMLVAAVATWLLTTATTYAEFLLAALAMGVAGGSFAVGVTFVSRWFPPRKQGTALGIFGAGNIGAAMTALLAPTVMNAWGWHAVAQLWAAVLAAVAIVFYLVVRDDPGLERRRASGSGSASFVRQLAPLKNLQVWRFALYYFFVFGGFVALSLWLPRYLIGVYGVGIAEAGLITASFALPAGLFRIVGGLLSDRIGARRVMYWTFSVSLVCTFLLSYPATHYTVDGIRGPIHFNLAIGVMPFALLLFVLGFFMSLGTAAVYKHVPTYYSESVGAVGGMVGMIGGLGGFVLPIAFGAMNDLVGIWTSCFMLLFLLAGSALTWMHFAILRMERRHFPQVQGETDLPEMMAAQEQRHDD
ncbi:MAG TPA: nitrate/nitrite transporter [Rhodanobacter sp.]|nr:nitrate/nitrite transporter [Rhodanobacter sp.]